MYYTGPFIMIGTPLQHNSLWQKPHYTIHYKRTSITILYCSNTSLWQEPHYNTSLQQVPLYNTTHYERSSITALHYNRSLITTIHYNRIPITIPFIMTGASLQHFIMTGAPLQFIITGASLKHFTYVSEQHRFWWDCTDAKAHITLCCLHMLYFSHDDVQIFTIIPLDLWLVC